MTIARQLFLPVFLAGAIMCGADASPPADTPGALAHVAKAKVLAGSDFAHSLFLCSPQGNAYVGYQILHGTNSWLPPTRAFDNLFFVGNEFVGVWVLKTSAGLVLFDSSESTEQARDHLVPGLIALGLDPTTIRYVLVTHGHWDHFGGAKYLQDTYGARIGLSGPDWDMLARTPVGGMERAPGGGDDRTDRLPPRRDLVIEDGQQLTVGDTTLALYITPGHTPGTISAIVPVKEGGTTYRLSLLGGTAFPPSLKPTERAGGLIAFEHSIERLSKISEAAGAVGIINTHIFADGSTVRLAAAGQRAPGEANPFILGTPTVVRYYAMFDECLKAAAERPLVDSEWNKPLPPKPVD